MLATLIQRYDKDIISFLIQFKNKRLIEILQAVRCHILLLIPYINLLNLSWIIKCLCFRNMEPLKIRMKTQAYVRPCLRTYARACIHTYIHTDIRRWCSISLPFIVHPLTLKSSRFVKFNTMVSQHIHKQLSLCRNHIFIHIAEVTISNRNTRSWPSIPSSNTNCKGPNRPVHWHSLIMFFCSLKYSMVSNVLQTDIKRFDQTACRVCGLI